MLLVFYSAGLSLARWLAYQLRFDFHVEPPFQHQFYLHWVWVVPMKLVLLYAFGQFSGLLSYFSVPDLRRLFYATTLASGLLLFTYYFSGGFYRPPRGVILIDYVLSFLFVATSRLSFRLVRERYLTPEGHASRRARRVGIVGAGDAGAALARDLTIKRGLGLQPVVFFDDNRSKWRSRVHDILVVGPPEALLDSKLDLQLEEIIIAMPSAPPKRVGEIVKLCQRARLKFGTVPSLDQLATGKVKVSQLRNVEIQDLLGREPVQLEKESIRQILAGRVVLVTGAGGSIGSELCRQIVQYNPKRLLLVEQSEGQAFEIEQELIGGGYGAMILPLVADILDPARMRYIFQRFTPELVFHAAAHKHVPMMESQPSEAIKNNTFGTAQVADLALEFNIERFVFISTDKAINPTNTMGATKRLAEMFVQALAAREPQRTKFMAVRFGNVLGSSGSVIPIFNKQIAAGGPVRVTHPDVTRYFMTIPEAVGLVLQSATQGQGGEIFVLDMGKPVKIVDLARQLIELSGLRPDEDIAIEFTGLRPGEKLFEEINHRGENIAPTNHPKILRFVCKPLPLDEVRGHLQRLAGQLHDLEPNQLKLQLKEAVPEYQPFLT
ncbi:MAG: polysaccharide biosynthesis protein [Verrucomicrobia bacterium]|nr:polysaccharide biosynthesis protein [Verrucomicrobiota bacterium]